MVINLTCKNRYHKKTPYLFTLIHCWPDLYVWFCLFMFHQVFDLQQKIKEEMALRSSLELQMNKMKYEVQVCISGLFFCFLVLFFWVRAYHVFRYYGEE